MKPKPHYSDPPTVLQPNILNSPKTETDFSFFSTILI